MKRIEISKELLSEVLQTVRFTCDNIYGNIACLRDGNGGGWDYNIYEFAFKCKEWALAKGFIIDERGASVYILTSDGVSDMWKSYGKPFCPYRVIEACEWILENKDNK